MAICTSLKWPSLDIKSAAGEAIAGGLELLQNSVVHPRPNLDGSSGFALECVCRRGTKTLTYFAKTMEERDAWCKLLRKHAVHHNLENGFELTRKVLGTGAYATVYLAKDRLTNRFVALKMIKRERLDKEERMLLAEEAWISQELKHEYCVNTHEFIENVATYVLVMEYIAGGELFERLVHHRSCHASRLLFDVRLRAGRKPINGRCEQGGNLLTGDVYSTYQQIKSKF